MYSIEYSRKAVRALIRMPRNVRDLIRSKVEELAAAPMEARNVRKLNGRPGYRLRVGDWRVIYDIEGARLVVRVLHIGARGGVYQ
ncbi:MAG: type II toxin-antitoxin system RelE/ParE family toxin [Rhodocyclaceae bacterium]|nr:type II toxin-antitoxin system RelE/ParE family toxin [Rhodocyclaceae bacterium]